MDLFVINRHTTSETCATKDEEQSKLDKVLHKIEINKRKSLKDKKRSETISKAEAIAKTTLKRKLKREIKEQIVSVPEQSNDEFITQLESKNDLNKDLDNGNVKKRKKNNKYEEIEGFTVLGIDKATKKEEVKRVLPKWLSNPVVISTDLNQLQVKVSCIKDLDKDLRKKLKLFGIKKFFPVQAEVIPWLIRSNKQAGLIFPRDICVSAPTGSGKTLAFVLPIIQSLRKHLVRKIRALVILPTQDLALQVFKSFKQFCEDSNVQVSFCGGKNTFAQEQKSLVAENDAFGYISKADILICTAGRLVDHIKHTKGLDLTELEFLVIDEADRVLDNIQNDWLYHLENHCSLGDKNMFSARKVNLNNLRKQRAPQKLLFSATLSQDPEKLEKLSLFQPLLFTSVVETDENELNDQTKIRDTFIGKYTTPKELTEKYIVTSLDLKPLILYKYIKNEDLTKSIIFTNSINEAHRLTVLLKLLFNNKIKIEEISSSLQIKTREQLIKEFAIGNVDVIVCTDTLARGIDLPDVQCVISYSAPKHLKTYIHRAGRTARAGALGTAVTLLNESQVPHFKSLLKQANKNNVEEVLISTDDLEELAKTYEAALTELKEIIGQEEKNNLRKIKKLKQPLTSALK